MKKQSLIETLVLNVIELNEIVKESGIRPLVVIGEINKKSGDMVYYATNKKGKILKYSNDEIKYTTEIVEGLIEILTNTINQK